MQRRDFLAGFLSRDIIDQEIQQLCTKWPAILEDNTIIRKAQGRYRINGREVTVSLRMREATKEDDAVDELKTDDSDDLIVRDGPLTQPFLDYVFDTGKKEFYAMAEPSKSSEWSKPLAPDLKGGQLAVADDRLEAMGIAWKSLVGTDAMVALGELPTMPVPPPLPRSSEPVQHAAGIHLATFPAYPSSTSFPASTQLCRTYGAEAECLVEIVMDLPIAPANNFPACHAMFCTPQVCAEPVQIASKMGPHGASSTKPFVQELHEADGPPGISKHAAELVVEPILAAEDRPVCLSPVHRALLPVEDGGPSHSDVPGKRRHKYGEVILPGEIADPALRRVSMEQEDGEDSGSCSPSLRPPPSKPPPLAIDEVHLAEL
mmetsp:Transcript_33588/g.77502  ORF Transcript_33588/g.77502 Transcript_33588/m.77502 type:complete len:375 (-) Transcript_33588:70-1194(-)